MKTAALLLSALLLSTPAAREPSVDVPPSTADLGARLAPTQRTGLAGWFTLAGGVVVAGAGGLFIGLAVSDYDRLADPLADPLSTLDAKLLVTRGRTFQTTGWALVAAGAAAVVVGTVLLAALPMREKVSVIAVVTPGGSAFVGVSGGLP